MLPSPQPRLMEFFGSRRTQKVNCLPIEAPLARIYKRSGFCIFVKSSNSQFTPLFVGLRSRTYCWVGTNLLALFKGEDIS